MTIQLGQIAPDFEADSTKGRIRFHEWLGNSWGLFFSHPKDFAQRRVAVRQANREWRWVRSDRDRP